jgi:polyhydroxyalkanoate synthesis regulator phasin
MRKILFIFLGLLLSTVIFAQSNELATMYNQLDSLENRILELQRENDRDVLRCLSNRDYRNYNDCSESIIYNNISYYYHDYHNNNWNAIAKVYAQEICECMVSKKHEIEAVKTQIKQLERRIDLIKNNSNPTQNVKK